MSRTVVRQVAREGIVLLSNDVLEAPAFKAAASLPAAPLTAARKTLGVIYLTTSDPITWSAQRRHVDLAAAARTTGRHPAAEKLREEINRLIADINWVKTRN